MNTVLVAGAGRGIGLAHRSPPGSLTPTSGTASPRKVVDATRREKLLQQVYTGRAGRPEEIAAAILWLCTASPAIVNGSILDINDGTFPR